MVERAVEWLYSRGRCVLRGPKKHLRSRRHLHSAFWSHGAGNIDLPPWWMLFLQNLDSIQGKCVSRRHRSPKAALSSGIQEIFLDFLYPLHTLSLIKRLKQSTNAHHLAVQHIKQRSRSYTSIATRFLNGAKAFGTTVGGPDEDASSTSTTETPQPGDTIRRGINEILDMKDPSWTYDELWQRYQDLLETSQTLSPQQLVNMLRRLGTSERKIDIERAVALFESIPVQERRAIHYSYAVPAALSLDDLDTAADIHREALGSFGSSVGTPALLRYTVEKERWQLAIDAWHPHWVDRLTYYTKPGIFTGVSSLSPPDLLEKAISAADFAISIAESSQSENALAARDFALELIRQTFRIRNTNFDVFRHWTLIQKTQILDASDMRTLVMALEQLLSSDRRDHGHNALWLYRILRKDSTFLPSRHLLLSVTWRLLAHTTHLGMLIIIEDWRKYHKKLPVKITYEVGRVFAQLGQVEPLQNLFREHCSTHESPRIDWYYTLLFVHNRRADTKGVVHALGHLQKDPKFKLDMKAYNYVIGTFTRIGDIDGALTWFNKALESEMQPDSMTYSLLMSMYAKRGDLETVHGFYQQAKIDGIEMSTKMFDSIVLANINDGRLAEAEQLVNEALRMDLQGSRTFMWNILLNAYALRRRVAKVSELHKQMRDSGIESNGMTYATLMTSLTIAKMPALASRILKTVMKRANMRRTSLHYAIAMRGHIATREFGEVFTLYQDMLDRNLKPNMSTQKVLIRAAASVDMGDQPIGSDSNFQPELLRAEDALEQTITNLDPKELAASEGRIAVGPELLDQAFSSTYFEFLIFLHGTARAYDKVTELYERYISTVRRIGGSVSEASPPILLLRALMVAHRNAGNHDEVERCWYLALDKAKQLACRAKAVTTEPGWVLYSRRFIMSHPLQEYITSLSQQGRFDDLISTIRDLESSGFALSTLCLNHYIQHLAKSPTPKYQLLAFELCERKLISNWQGWKFLGHPSQIFYKLRRYEKGRLHLLGQPPKPTYLTLVELAAAYLQATQGTRLITPKRILNAAPKTTDAIINMPKSADDYQITLLRRG